MQPSSGVTILRKDRVIARLAEQHMNEKARDALAELLDPNETIADASTWADFFRANEKDKSSNPMLTIELPQGRPKCARIALALWPPCLRSREH
jgi:hypothetical protein